jgi:GT2 family glycosyltransferase
MRLADARPSTCRPCLTASPLGSDDSPENGAPQCRHAEFSRDSCIYGEIYEDVRAHGVVLAIEAVHPAASIERGPVDAVNGAFMLVRRQALDEVGLFDEQYWMYMEDLDLCYRFRAAGWITWYEPSVVAQHVKGASSGPYRALRLNYAFHYGCTASIASTTPCARTSS